MNSSFSPQPFHADDMKTVLNFYSKLHKSEETTNTWLQHRLVVISGKNGLTLDLKKLNPFERVGALFGGRASLEKIVKTCKEAGIEEVQFKFLEDELFRPMIVKIPGKSEKALIFKQLSRWERFVGFITGRTSQRSIRKFLVNKNHITMLDAKDPLQIKRKIEELRNKVFSLPSVNQDVTATEEVVTQGSGDFRKRS